MEVVKQKLEDILAGLRPLAVDWEDDTARRVIAKIKNLPIIEAYTVDDVRGLLDEDFDDALLVCRLFLGLSKDAFTGKLKTALDGGAAGVTSYRADRQRFLEGLLQLGILEAMATETRRKPEWSDVLVERLRSGRGSAISGQKRGRSVEDFAEAVVSKVFGRQFVARCTFTGPTNKTAKCDFAIPSKIDPRIIIEAKGFGATGSKMTNVIGDIGEIIAAKRPDAAFLFFTDGITWQQRKNDLRKIVRYQNEGGITRIYTYAMADQFEADLRILKRESGL